MSAHRSNGAPAAWLRGIMARRPTIPEAEYRKIVEFLAAQGYDTTRIQKVPQRWE